MPVDDVFTEETDNPFYDPPVCFYCEKVIDRFFYLINDEILCRDCLEKHFRKDINEYIE